MSFANRLANTKSLTERDSAERTFNKLMRTFAAQVETLQRYRTKSRKRSYFSMCLSMKRTSNRRQRHPACEREGVEETSAPTPLIPDARQAPMDIISEPRRARVPLRRK